jgi:hypothetical protein
MAWLERFCKALAHNGYQALYASCFSLLKKIGAGAAALIKEGARPVTT